MILQRNAQFPRGSDRPFVRRSSGSRIQSRRHDGILSAMNAQFLVQECFTHWTAHDISKANEDDRTHRLRHAGLWICQSKLIGDSYSQVKWPLIRSIGSILLDFPDY